MSQLVVKEKSRALIPIEYEKALAALNACVNLDEAKYIDQKIDLLNMWVSVNGSDDAIAAAKRLKLYSYRRLGELALQLRPKGRDRHGKLTKGPISILLETGLTHSRADAAMVIARLSPEKFDQILQNPCSPTTAATIMGRNIDYRWRYFSLRANALQSLLNKTPPKEMVDLIVGLGEQQEATMKAIVRGLLGQLKKMEMLIEERQKR